jgi:hypothetical protein
MLFFVLWTLPILTIIWLTGFKSSSNTKKVWQKILNYVIWMLIIIFGFISLNSQFTILWFPSFNFNSNTTETIQEQNIENNVIQMIYSKAGLIPSVINLEAWKDYKIIIDVQTTVYGCMSTIFLEKLNTQMRVLNAWTKLEFDIKSPQKWSYDFLCAMWVPHNSKVVVE